MDIDRLHVDTRKVLCSIGLEIEDVCQSWLLTASTKFFDLNGQKY